MKNLSWSIFTSLDLMWCRCMMHVPRCMPGSLTSGFLWSRWGKRSRHSWCMRNPQFYVFGMRPMAARWQTPFCFLRGMVQSVQYTNSRVPQGFTIQYIERLDDYEIQAIRRKQKTSLGLVPSCSNDLMNSPGNDHNVAWWFTLQKEKMNKKYKYWYQEKHLHS